MQCAVRYMATISENSQMIGIRCGIHIVETWTHAVNKSHTHATNCIGHS